MSVLPKSLSKLGKKPKPLESDLAAKVKKLFESRGWKVINVHGNAFTKGLPDKYCIDVTERAEGRTLGQRWVELKRPEVGRYTKDQLATFPLIEKAGIGVWVMTDATDAQYKMVVSSPPNWRDFLRKSDIEKIKEMYAWFT